MNVAIKWLGMLLVVAILDGCSCAQQGPGLEDAGSGCFEDTDCGNTTLFFCDQNTSTCQPACRSKADCTAAVRGADNALDFCGGQLACECDEGKCVAALCSADLDCGNTLVCRNGACVAEAAAFTVASCEIHPAYVLGASGSKVKFHVLAKDASGRPVVTKAGATWTAEEDNVVNAGPLTGLAVELTLGAGKQGPSAAVKASFGVAACTAIVQLTEGTVSGTALKAVITDELTGYPVNGAVLFVMNAATTSLTETSAPSVDGEAQVSGTVAATSGAIHATVFHPDYSYLTIANYALSGASRVLHFPLRRNPIDFYGGYRGTVEDVPQTGNVHAAIASMSLPGSVTDLSIAQLLGPSVPTDIVVGSVVNQQDVPVPAGIFASVSTDNPIKTQVSAQGAHGICQSNFGGALAEDLIAEGRCGTRTAWALAADIPLAELPLDLLTAPGGTANLDLGETLMRMLPTFRRFHSSVIRDVEFELKEAGGLASFAPNLEDTAHFTPKNHQFHQMPLGFAFVVQTPNLPTFQGQPMDALTVLGAAVVPGRGLVPLGLGAGVDKDNNGAIDVQGSLSATNLLQMRMAPTHHGLEGADYAMVSLALSFAAQKDPLVGFVSSGLFHRLSPNRLAFDPTGASAKVQLAGPYLKPLETASFDWSARRFSFATGPSFTTESLVRVSFSDANDRRWTIFTPPTATSFVLPDPAAVGSSFPNRLFHKNNATGERSALVVQSMQLHSNPAGSGAALSFKDLVQFNSTGADRLLDYTQAFTVNDYGRPAVEFVSPSDAGAQVAAQSKVTVRVTRIPVGSAAGQAAVAFSFTGGAGCPGAPIVVAEDDPAKAGEVSFNLPSGCSGAPTLEAKLVKGDDQATAVSPPVVSSLSVTIQ